MDWFENAGLKNVILNALSIFKLMFQQWLQLLIYFCRGGIIHVKYVACHDRNTFREDFLEMRLKYCKLSGKGNGFQGIEKNLNNVIWSCKEVMLPADGFLLPLDSASFGS